MVEKIIISPNEVRAYGNIVDEKDVDDYDEYKSLITSGEDTVNGVLLPVNTVSYSVYNIGLHFNSASKVLYVEDDGGLVDSFGFSDKALVLASDSVEFGFEDDALYLDTEVVHDYSLSFDSSSYTAVGGVVTVSATLLDGGVACSGATVTFSSSTSTTATATTDSNGIATATISFSGSTTLTASIGGASDTCTVTVSSYLFYDDVSSDRSSEYTNASIQTSSRTGYLALSYNSGGYYTIQASTNEGNHYAKWISAVTGEDNLKFSCEVSTNSFNGGNRFGIIVGDVNDYKSERYQISNKTLEHLKQSGTSTETVMDSHTLSLTANAWYKMEYIVQGTSYTFTISDMSSNVLYTNTGTFDSSVITSSTSKQYGLYYLNYGSSYTKYYRNIKIEAL